MQNKILIDSFILRFKVHESGITFANPGINDLSFAEAERNYYLDKIINSILVHDKIVVRASSIYDLIDLIGLSDLLVLVKNNVLEIIDDGGILPGVKMSFRNDWKQFEDEVDMMNLEVTFIEGLAGKIEDIEEKLEERYFGKTDAKIAKLLIQYIEEKKINIDGKKYNEIVKKEIDNDLKNDFLSTQTLGRPESSERYHMMDMLPMMFAAVINRSLIYQSELNIKSFETGNFAKKLIESKLTPIIKNHKNNRSQLDIFETVSYLKKIPNVSTLYNKGIISLENIIEIREKLVAKKFRNWFFEKETNEKEIFNELLASKEKDSKILKLIRFIIPEMISVNFPLIGISTELIESFLLDKFLRHNWHPNLFLDDALSNYLRKEERKYNREKSKELFIKRFGNVERNEKCPCGSGKKFKHCHG